MGRIVVTEFVSLDGVMEDPGGAEDFKYGGWSFEISRGDEGDKFKLDETMESDALLLGRVTYEGFAEAWPSRDGRVRRQVQQACRSTSSRRRCSDPEWTNSTVLERRPRRRGREAQGASTTATSSSTAAPSSRRRCSSTTSSTSCG